MKTPVPIFSKLTLVLLSAFPVMLLVGFIHPPTRYETRVLFDLEHPEHNGELISNGYPTLDHVIAAAFIVTALGFIVGLVFLLRSLHLNRR